MDNPANQNKLGTREEIADRITPENLANTLEIAAGMVREAEIDDEGAWHAIEVGLDALSYVGHRIALRASELERRGPS